MAIMKIKTYDLREGLNADKLLPMHTLSGCFLSATLCSSVDDTALQLAAQGPDHMLLSSPSLPGLPPKPTAYLLLLLSWRLIYKQKAKWPFRNANYITFLLTSEISQRLPYPFIIKCKEQALCFHPHVPWPHGSSFCSLKILCIEFQPRSLSLLCPCLQQFPPQIDSLAPDIIPGSMQMSPQRGLPRSYLNNSSHQLLPQSPLRFIALYWFILHCIFIL